MNGKGDKLRKGSNLSTFRKNFDEICWKPTKQSQPPNIKEKEEKPKNKQTENL